MEQMLNNLNITDFISKCTFYICNTSRHTIVCCAAGPQNGHGEKRCEIQGGGQEMAVMVG